MVVCEDIIHLKILLSDSRVNEQLERIYRRIGAMSAGAIRRSWRPVAQTVLWHFEHAGVSSAGNFTAVTKTGDFMNRGLELPCIGRAWRNSANVPHIRWGSNSSALRSEEEKEQAMPEREKGKPDGKELVRSNYWGIVSKIAVRADGSPWPWNSFRPWETYTPDMSIKLEKHHQPENWEDRLAYWSVKACRVPTDLFFRKRYGCRAMMLETIAAVPGMVGGMLLHLRSLRKFEHSGGWIKALLDEAENERMHLMTFMEVAEPRWYERALVVSAQAVFFNAYFLFYLLAPRVAHRFVGYLEEEAVYSYTQYLQEIEKGNIEDVPAPAIAIDYWRLAKDATLRDVILVVRADEGHRRDVNHYASDIRKEGKQLFEEPAPVDYH